MLNNIPTNISVVEGNKGFKIHFTCQDSTGTAIDLTGSTITFRAQSESDTAVSISGAMVIEAATSGTCYYPIGSTDFSVAGTYNAQIELSYSAGAEIITFDGIIITVTDKLPI